MYITAPGGDSEHFQLSELDAERAVASLNGDDFFYFTTLFGRHCVVNFKLVQAVHVYEAAKISTSDRVIEGALVHLVGRKKVLDIPGNQAQIREFFRQLKTGLPFAQLEDWRVRTSDIVTVVASDAYMPLSQKVDQCAQNTRLPKAESDSSIQDRLCDHDWQPDGQTLSAVRYTCTKCQKTQLKGLDI
jgi:hypothetical protein